MKINQKWEWMPEELQESTEELENPARGWYEIYTFRAEDGIHPQELRWSLREGETLALVLIDLGAYRDRALGHEALENIRSILIFLCSTRRMSYFARCMIQRGKDASGSRKRLILC